MLFSIVFKFARTNQSCETNDFTFKGVLERLQPYINKLQDTKESHVNNKRKNQGECQQLKTHMQQLQNKLL